MAIDSIDPISDARVKHCNVTLDGRQYHYLLAGPSQAVEKTIFLIHGWPDLAIGWRYQIRMLVELGYRVVCPDMIGYGGTDAPRVPPEPLSTYSFKRAAEDIRQLAMNLGSTSISLGGHDWGGAIVYRVALWFPELVKEIFSVCTPFWAPSQTFHSTEDIVKRSPNWTYQIHLASGEVEEHIRSKEEMRQFLNGAYDGKGPNGEVGFHVRKGALFDNLPKLGKTPLLDEKTLECYVDSFMRTGIHGPLNWYRTREQNYRDELQLQNSTIDVPLLFIQATKDAALPPAMSQGMEKYCPMMTRKSVDTTHWALWEAPEEVNAHIKGWLEAQDQPKSVL